MFKLRKQVEGKANEILLKKLQEHLPKRAVAILSGAAGSRAFAKAGVDKADGRKVRAVWIRWKFRGTGISS